MTPEGRWVVALSGRDEDAALVRYADTLAALNREAGRAFGGEHGRSTSDAAAPAGVAVVEAEGLVLSAPHAIEYVEVPPDRSLDRLLALAADVGTGVLLVGEAIGRRGLRALVRRAPCSVWFLPHGAAPRVRRILVPVEFSVRAADCLRVATTLARLAGARECVALHAYFNASPLADADQDRALRAGIAEAYARFLGPIDLLGVRVRPLFRECPVVADAVNQAAADEGADLVVLASRGRTWASGLLPEGVAGQTLRRCAVPLLVVKHFGACRGLLSLLRDPGQGRRDELQFN